MRVTTSLLVRNLLAKLHPPGPATPRESKQLLNVLETSFRKHLDELHPAPQKSNQTDEQDISRAADSFDGPTNATDFYLSSVLQHPLLASKHAGEKHIAGLAETATGRFENALLKGPLTLEIFREYARLYYRGIKSGEKIGEGRRLGPRIATWLSSQNGTLKKNFLIDHRTVADALLVMYADGLEEVVWSWLRVLYGRDWSSDRGLFGSIDLHDPQMLRAEDHFVSLMMRASIRRGVLDEAAHQFVQASEYRAASGRAAVEIAKASENRMFYPLLSSWKRLSTSVLYRRFHHGIDEVGFDQMLKYSIPFFKHAVISKSFLLPYHPTKPSAQALSQDLQSPAFVEGFLTWQQGLNEMYHKAFLMTILDSAQLALDQHNASEAKMLLEFAEKHYPGYISTRKEADTADRVQHARQEVAPKLAFHFQLAVP